MLRSVMVRKGHVVKSPALAFGSHSFICPICEAGELRSGGHYYGAQCPVCGCAPSRGILETLRQIISLPDALGSHACEECAHPEMRRLPDGTYHCPACGSEVLPIDASSAPLKPDEHGVAYWAGWVDGRFGERGSFVDNPNLARWENPSDRLAYYHGHRAGNKARRLNPGFAPLNPSRKG
jgi:hypothetical protein